MKFLILILVIGFTISGCNKKKKNEWISHGDPAELVRGTDLNYGISSYPPSFNFKNLYLQNASTFVSKSPKMSITQEISAEDPNQRNLLEKSNRAYAVQTSGLDPLILQGIYDGDSYVVTLKNSSNQVELVQVARNGRNLSLNKKYSHISFNDKNEVSILFYWSTPELLNLTYLNLAPINQEKPLALNKAFNYLGGKGKGVRHNKSQTLVVQDCLRTVGAVSESLVKARNLWLSEISDKLSVSIQKPSRCLPFSDLNSHGAYYIRNFRVSAADGIFQTGLVWAVGDSEISDSDMLIFDNEWNRRYQLSAYYSSFEEALTTIQNHPESFADGVYEKLKADVDATFIHEFGHILGLDHMFEGAPSHMSYDENVPSDRLSAYDKAAIRELYK